MSKRNSKRTIHVGTIHAVDILRGPKGHQVKIGGCGAHDNRPKRLRTRGDRCRQAIKEGMDHAVKVKASGAENG